MQRAESVFQAYLRRHELATGGTVSPAWSPDGSSLWLVQSAPEQTGIVQICLRTGEAQSLLDPRTNRTENTGSADSFSTALGWLSDDEPTPKLWTRYDYMSSTLQVPEQRSPSGEWFAGIHNHNVSLRAARARDSGARQLTFDGTAERLWDLEGLRWKMNSGKRVTFRSMNPWSPDSLTLAAYRRDITGVFRMPRVNWLKPFEDVDYLPYHKVGSKLDRVDPAFLDVRSGHEVRVQLGDTQDCFIQWLAWHAAGQEALLIVYTRDFKRVEIHAADRYSGATRLLLTESVATFVKVQHDAMFSGDHGFYPLPDGSGFLWLSTREGWSHIYHYGMSGHLIARLTTGAWPVHEIVHIGTDGLIYFTASIDPSRPYDVHVCRVSLAGSPIDRLTEATGVHSPVFSPGGAAFLDTHSAVDRPTRTDLVRSDGSHLQVLAEMDITRLQAVGYTPPMEFAVKAADGVTDLWGVIYRPFDFDPAKSYPLIEYIYAGPQTAEAPHFFAVDASMMSAAQIPWALAQLGYIVVCLDARGTPGRSKEFHDFIYANWKGVIPDHAAAIRELSTRHTWIDSNRVGIMGHSWGGYFATLALIQAPEIYHTAVSYAPAYDVWDAIYYEPYLGSPLENRKAYDEADILQQAAKIKRPLMFAVGTSDYVIVASTMKMSWALIEAGIDHDFIIIPQAHHQFVGAEERYFLMKATQWLDRHLKNRTSVDGSSEP